MTTTTSSPSVRSLLRPLLLALALAVVVLGGLGLVTAALAERGADRLTGEVLPALTATEQVLQDLTDAETGLRAWALTGQPEVLEPYREGRSQLPGHLAEVRAYAEGDAELEALVRRQTDAASAWLADYADVRVARSGGMRSFDPELFQVGKDRFDVVRATNADLVDALQRDAQQVREAAERAGSALVVGIVLVALVLAVVGASAARRLRQRVVDPLASMESVAHLLATDPDADPPALLPGGAADGAREVRAVAAALDELAAAQQRARAAADALAAEQRALDQARQDFVSNVSHELRTPLTTIAGYLEVAEEELEGRLDPLQQRMLDATVRNVDRLRALIDDILTLSRVEAAATDLETIPLRQLVTDVVDDLRTGASRRGIVLGAVVPDDDELLVLADRAQLSRAILNLASNAVKFSRDGGVVELAARRDGDHLVVVVRDEGIGVPAADLPSLGTRFFRAGNAVAGAVPGTGLGLRIVQAIVGQHGGSLQFESVEGKGTTVTVRLPARVAA